MKKILKSAIIISAALLLLWFLFSMVCVVFVSVTAPGYADVCIFEDIGECENLENSADPGTSVERYEGSEKDARSEGLSYSDYYGAMYSSPELRFEIFAYQFSSEEDAEKYYMNATGRACEDGTDYFVSSGFPHYSIVVLDGRKAYFAECFALNAPKMHEFLAASFSAALS